MFYDEIEEFRKSDYSGWGFELKDVAYHLEDVIKHIVDPLDDEFVIVIRGEKAAVLKRHHLRVKVVGEHDNGDGNPTDVHAE